MKPNYGGQTFVARDLPHQIDRDVCCSAASSSGHANLAGLSVIGAGPGSPSTTGNRRPRSSRGRDHPLVLAQSVAEVERWPGAEEAFRCQIRHQPMCALRSLTFSSFLLIHFHSSRISCPALPSGSNSVTPTPLRVLVGIADNDDLRADHAEHRKPFSPPQCCGSRGAASA